MEVPLRATNLKKKHLSGENLNPSLMINESSIFERILQIKTSRKFLLDIQLQPSIKKTFKKIKLPSFVEPISQSLKCQSLRHQDLLNPVKL